MKEEDILKALELPKSTWVMRTFPFNKLSNHLAIKQRKFLSETITTRGIRVLASINPNNTNIPIYENETERYEEIHVFLIKVENLNYAKEIFKILSNIIPYPLIIIFNHVGDYQIILGTYEKRPQKLSLKTTELHMSSLVDNLGIYLSKLSFKRMDKLNLQSFYKSILKSMLNIELRNQYGVTNISLGDNNLLKKLNDLDKKIEGFVSKAKKEKQMNRRIEYQMKVNILKDKKNKLLQGENENE